MATLKSNGGIYRLLERLEITRAGFELRTKIAVCQNGKCLRNTGFGWKVYPIKSPVRLARDELVLVFLKRGYRLNESAAARALISRSEADAHAHQHAIRARRLAAWMPRQ